jgi:hypothetical protein
MIIDKLLEFDPAGTLITVTAASTNVLDLHGASLIPAAASKPGRDMGAGVAPGAVPRLMVQVQTTFTAVGAATLQVQIQGAPDDGTGAAGAYVTYAETPAIAQGEPRGRQPPLRDRPSARHPQPEHARVAAALPAAELRGRDGPDDGGRHPGRARAGS